MGAQLCWLGRIITMQKLVITLYSDDSAVRKTVIAALGKQLDKDGKGVTRQLKDDVFNCPPVLLITARASDNWLATWSKAEATVLHPIDPFTIASKCASLLKANSALANN